MPYADFAPILKKLRSSSFDGSMVSGLCEILLLNQNNEYNFTFNFCKERVVGISIVMYFRKDFYLIPAINSVIRNLVSSGIVEHLHKKYLDEEKLSARKTSERPKNLKIDHVLGIFQILASGVLLSFICFVVEIICGHTKSAKAKKQKIETQKTFKFVH